MESYNYVLTFVVIFFVLYTLLQARKRRNATIVNHRKNHKNKESLKMKELAEKFVGKECLVYTIASSNESIKGVITSVTDNGLLIDYEGNMQAVNLEYVTRIREWPKNSKGKRKNVIIE